MRVKVRLWGVFQELSGKSEFILDMPQRATVGGVIDQLIRLYGERFKEELLQPGARRVKPYVKLLLNGHGATLGSKLREGDVVAIFPPVGGG